MRHPFAFTANIHSPSSFSGKSVSIHECQSYFVLHENIWSAADLNFIVRCYRSVFLQMLSQVDEKGGIQARQAEKNGEV